MIRGEIKILKEVIEAVVHEITVTSVELNAPTAKLYTCNTLYLNTGKIVIIDSVKYRVVSFVINKFIEVKPLKGSTLPDIGLTNFTIDNPKFYDGTPRRVTAENTLDKQVANYNLPIIWLLMWVEIKAPDNKFNSFVTSTIQGANLFFLDDCNVKDWNQEDHRIEIWEPMENEMWHIFRAIESRGDIFDRNLNEPDRRFHSNFGEYLTNKGYDGTILAGTFSGVQAIMDIPYVIDPCECDKVEVCKPVRFLLDGVLAETIAAGGDLNILVENQDGDTPDYDYDEITDILTVQTGGGSASIDIDINGASAYVGQSTDVDIPVIGTDALPKGTWNGTSQVIGDSDISINSSIIENLASELPFNIPIINTALTPVGHWDGTDDIVVDSLVNIKDSAANLLYAKSVVAEGTVDQTISDSTVNVKDSAGTTLYAKTVKAQGTDVQTITDTVVTLNSTALTPNKSQTNKAMTITRANGDPVTVTTVTNTETTFLGTVPNVVVPKNVANSMKTGAADLGSFATNDDANTNRGRLTSFFVLDSNNPYGNTTRFLDTLGGTAYADNVVINWATYDQVNGKVLGMYRLPQAAANQATLLAAQPYTYAGKSDWMLPNEFEGGAFVNRGIFRNPFNYPPINYNILNSSYYLWSNYKDSSTAGWRWADTQYGLSASTAVYPALLVRYYTLAELGL